jgi:hypothetical protein
MVLTLPRPCLYPKICKSNDKYNIQINKFKYWCDLNDRQLPNGRYLSRDNVDEYYDKIICVEMIHCENDHAYSVHRALQILSDTVERPDNAQPPLVIRDKENPNSRVNQALFARELRYVEQHTTKNFFMDPHDNLPTNVLSFEDHAKTMRHLLSNTNTEEMWQNFASSFTVDFSTYLRIDSTKKMRYCDLLTEPRGHVPKGINANILGLIMQKFMHKADKPQNPNARARTQQAAGGRSNSAGDNNGMSGQPIKVGGKRVCFMWRHRVFECCGTAMIAISLFMRLFFDTEFSFLEPQPSGPNNNVSGIVNKT